MILKGNKFRLLSETPFFVNDKNHTVRQGEGERGRRDVKNASKKQFLFGTKKYWIRKTQSVSNKKNGIDENLTRKHGVVWKHVVAERNVSARNT